MDSRASARPARRADAKRGEAAWRALGGHTGTRGHRGRGWLESRPGVGFSGGRCRPCCRGDGHDEPGKEKGFRSKLKGEKVGVTRPPSTACQLSCQRARPTLGARTIGGCDRGGLGLGMRMRLRSDRAPSRPMPIKISPSSFYAEASPGAIEVDRLVDGPCGEKGKEHPSGAPAAAPLRKRGEKEEGRLCAGSLRLPIEHRVNSSRKQW